MVSLVKFWLWKQINNDIYPPWSGMESWFGAGGRPLWVGFRVGSRLLGVHKSRYW